MLRYILPLAVLLLSGPQAQAKASTIVANADDLQKIHDVDRGMLAAIQARNTNRMTAYYAANATLMNPQTAPVTGTAAIHAAWSDIFADPNFVLEFSASETQVSGDLAFVRGTFRGASSNAAKQAVSASGSYVTIFRKLNGRWLAVADISTPDR